MQKRGSKFSPTMKGIARYLCGLAKYTTQAKASAEDVINARKARRNRIPGHDHRT